MTTALGRRLEALSDEDVQLVHFALDGERYALPILEVEEIIRHQPVTTVPSSPSEVSGIINLRDRVIPVIDLRERFGLPAASVGRHSRIIVVEASNTTVGLVVDSVDEVRAIRKDSIEPPSPLATSVDSAFLMGVGRLDRGNANAELVILLDLEGVISQSMAKALQTISRTPELEPA